MKRFLCILFLVVSVFFLCSAKKNEKKTENLVENSVVDVKKSKKKKKNDEPSGGPRRITLPGNPTTGYVWRFNDMSGKGRVMLTENKFVPSSSQEGMVSVGGNFVFEFIPLRQGDIELYFTHERPWDENEVIDEKHFYFYIDEDLYMYEEDPEEIKKMAEKREKTDEKLEKVAESGKNVKNMKEKK